MKYRERVKRIQAYVGSEVDGYIGPVTRNRILRALHIYFDGTATEEIKKIQSATGAKPDGIIGPQTLGTIEKHLGIGMLAIDADHIKLDKRSEQNIQTLAKPVQPVFRKWLSEVQKEVDKHGYHYILISGNRTCSQQNALYAKGRTKPGKKVTNAKCGQSNHNFGVAVDGGVFTEAGVYMDGAGGWYAEEAMKMHKLAAKIAKKYGLKWGGDWTSFKDYPHFEYDTGLTMSQMRARLQSGKAIV